MSFALLNSVNAVMLGLIAVYNLTKIPWYMGWIPTPEYGLETSIPFHLLGYRSPKLISHPTLFLAPHALMGSTLLTFLALYLLMDRNDPTRRTLALTYVAIAMIFGLHAIPERKGIPNRTKDGKPLNEVALTFLFVGCIMVLLLSSYEGVGMMVSVLPLLAAAGMELSKPLHWCVLRLQGKALVPAKSEDGDKPLPRNPEGYSGCPFAKRCDIVKSAYPIPKSAKY